MAGTEFAPKPKPVPPTTSSLIHHTALINNFPKSNPKALASAMPSILLLGASRNIGHHLARLILENDDTSTTLTLLCRRELAETDPLFPHVQSGQVKIVRGDALVRDDVERAWSAAGGKECQKVCFTLGTPMDEIKFG